MSRLLLALGLLVCACSSALAASDSGGSQQTPPKEEAKPLRFVSLVIKSQHEFQLGDRHLTSVLELEQELKTRVKLNPDFAVIISTADTRDQFGLTIAVLDGCRNAAVKHIKVEGAGTEKAGPGA